MNFQDCERYSHLLQKTLQEMQWHNVITLGNHIKKCWHDKKNVFICGNGGSCGNAVHIANDLMYPITKKKGDGVRSYALGANVSTLTCLANDEGYENIFSYELSVHGNDGDILIVLSGSGNSSNVLKVLSQAKAMNITSYAMLGFDGGKALSLADHVIHFKVDDMQVAEDMQMIAFNMMIQSCMRDAGILN